MDGKSISASLLELALETSLVASNTIETMSTSLLCLDSNALAMNFPLKWTFFEEMSAITSKRRVLQFLNRMSKGLPVCLCTPTAVSRYNSTAETLSSRVHVDLYGDGAERCGRGAGAVRARRQRSGLDLQPTKNANDLKKRTAVRVHHSVAAADHTRLGSRKRVTRQHRELYRIVGDLNNQN
ncbi:hypothetical protein J6590_060436 [Homalodisca vitripennis]|nr:hypothetical protein J6590_060436 [Homalodisca vitripennis]